MSNLYKRYITLLNKWPLDETKSPDFGQHLRDQIKIAFPKGENTRIEDQEKCKRQLESLERLASNYYGNKYPCDFKKTASGIKPELCNLFLRPETQLLLAQEKRGFFSRFVKKIKTTITRYTSSSKLE